MDSNHRSLATCRGSRHGKCWDFCRCLPAGYPTVRCCGGVRFRLGRTLWLRSRRHLRGAGRDHRGGL